MTTEEYHDDHAIPSPVMVNKANLSAIRRDSTDNSLSSDAICNMFNEFIIEFERMEQSGITTNMFLDAVEEIADAVMSIIPYKLLDPKVLYHPLMYFLHQMLVDLIANWRASQLRLNIQESDIFLKIVLIFVHAAEQAPTATAEQERMKIRDLIATKKFIFLVREQVIDSTTTKEGINDDPNICTLCLLIHKLLKGTPFFYSLEQNERLVDDSIIGCLDSYDYIQALRQLKRGEKLSDIDRLLLFNCWEYIPFTSTDSRIASSGPNSIKFVENFYDTILTRFESALDEAPPITTLSLAYIFERCNQLLHIHNLSCFDKHAPEIIDRLTKILQSSQATNDNDDALTIAILEAFYNLTKNPDIRPIMKKRQLTSLFKKYISTDMGEKRKLALGILAEILDEDEINNNSHEITAFFVNELKQLDPNGYNPHVDTTLSSLTVLMQHEQIKNELVNQGGLEPLISFVRDGDPNKQSEQQLEDALKILWSCAIHNPQALNTLQQDTKLMTRVNQLFENAKNSENNALEKAADGLIWKVEKEEKFKQQQAEEAERKQQEKKRKAQETDVEEEEEEEEQYDCMISYSWADMDLAHRIFHHLTEKLGYKVWLDQEQMHGSTIQAMANAVEGAQFILMCMSDTYKRSANCQSEAEYAFNRKKHIVPIKMKKDFTADGWLGFILGTRMYIDFGTYEFDKAIVLLDNEIQLQKKKRKEAKEQAKVERKAARAIENPIDEEEEEVIVSRPVVRNGKVNKDNISNWNEDDVHDFLMKNSLIAMIPLCDGITGEELSNLYVMCRANSSSMYRSLKFELLHGHQRILPISTYLRFISRMRAVCEDGISTNVRNVKKMHENTVSDDE